MRKLPVTAALAHAIRSTFNNLGFAFHISWPWMLVLLPLNIILTVYFGLHDLGSPWGDGSEFSWDSIWPVALQLIASIVAYSSIAVNWHRYVLLDDVAEGWDRLRIDGLTWKYIGNFFLIALVGTLVAVPPLLIGSLIVAIYATAIGDVQLLIVPVILAVYASVIVILYRLMVKLPAIAIGRNDFGLKQAWAATDGNSWRILGLLLLFILCIATLGMALLALTYVFGFLGSFALSVSIAAQVLMNWLATVLGVTLLTSLYGFFAEDRDF